MLIALSALVALQAAPSAAAPPGEPILVIASRLDAVLFNLSLNRVTGQMKCTIARSSGRPEIDAYMCDVARYCARTSRKSKAAIEQCIADRKKAYLARSAERGE